MKTWLEEYIHITFIYIYIYKNLGAANRRPHNFPKTSSEGLSKDVLRNSTKDIPGRLIWKVPGNQIGTSLRSPMGSSPGWSNRAPRGRFADVGAGHPIEQYFMAWIALGVILFL